MSDAPVCPQCGLENTYRDGGLFVCADCGLEWNEGEVVGEEEAVTVRDCNGNVLSDGDSVVVIKDLPVKGSSTGIKQGTVIRNIRLVEDDATHIFDRKNDVFVKTVFVRKQ
jgi:protein PhnA